MKQDKCGKCGSIDIIPRVQILDQGEGSDRILKVILCEKPDAFLFKGAHYSNLYAVVCGRCGFTELYTTKPAELLQVHQQRHAAGGA